MRRRTEALASTTGAAPIGWHKKYGHNLHAEYGYLKSEY